MSGFDALRGDLPDMTAYCLRPDPAPMVPAEPRRGWMDATTNKGAYRCIPISIANATGWELLSPFECKVRWSGGMNVDAVTVEAVREEDAKQVASFLSSHFGSGIVTFSPGYLFRTSPGWALWVRGSPNEPYSNLQPLEGIVETDWLPFTFTMNWRFCYPGEITIPKGARLCFVTPVAHSIVGEIEPRIVDIEEDPDLAARFKTWRESRENFTSGLREKDPEMVKKGWERRYVNGETLSAATPYFHINKRRMKTPKMPED
jgi:hypothetical protein